MAIGSNPSPNHPNKVVHEIEQLQKRLEKTADPAKIEKLEHRMGELNLGLQLDKANKMKDGSAKVKKLHQLADGYQRLGDDGKASSLDLRANTIEKLDAVSGNK